MKILIKEGIVKKMVNRVLGYDLTDRIEMITSWEELPESLKRNIYSNNRFSFNWYLNNHGPMFIFDMDGNKYMTQFRDGEWIIYSNDEDDPLSMPEDEFLDKIGIGFMGVKLQQIIDEFVEE
jgi:hypothetical protein